MASGDGEIVASSSAYDVASSSAYDEVPYSSYPFRQSHPDRMASVAKLFGLGVTDVGRCRVLELGCAGGGNLVPMAEQLPESQFVGVDLSPVQIQAAQEFADQSSLKNIEFHAMNIMEIGHSLGKFDYIICHGVFSWVPKAVQETIFSLANDLLTDEGIAYISYNTFPGWHMRGMIREMMLFHTEQFETPQESVAQARGLLDFLAQNAQANSAYGTILKTEAESLKNSEDYYLFHDHLEEVNDPVYFHQFIARAQEHDLDYLGEAVMATMYAGHFSQEVASTLQKVARDLVQMEQYLDFIRNRTFRQTLLCRRDRKISRKLQPEKLNGLYFASPLIPAEENFVLQSAAPLKFQHPGNSMNITTQNPLFKAALLILAENWPQVIEFEDLLSRARHRATNEEICGAEDYAADRKSLGGSLLECYVSDLIEIRSQPLISCIEPSDRPVGSKVARTQAAQGKKQVTNLRHESGPLPEFLRRLLMMLDGSKDRDAIVNKIFQLAKEGTIVIRETETDEPIPSSEQTKIRVRKSIDEAITYLAGNSLLTR